VLLAAAATAAGGATPSPLGPTARTELRVLTLANVEVTADELPAEDLGDAQQQRGLRLVTATSVVDVIPPKTGQGACRGSVAQGWAIREFSRQTGTVAGQPGHEPALALLMRQ
jgi:hypothetical protein